MNISHQDSLHSSKFSIGCALVFEQAALAFPPLPSVGILKTFGGRDSDAWSSAPSHIILARVTEDKDRSWAGLNWDGLV